MPGEKRERFPLMLLVMEIVFVIAFIAFFFLKVLTITVQPLSWQFSPEGFDYFILLVLAGLAGWFHFWLTRRYPKIAAIEGEVTRLYREKAKSKVSSARQDRRVVAALAIELLFVLIIAFALWALIDQEITLIKTDIPWLGRALAVIILVGLGVYGYFRYTSPFFRHGGYFLSRREKPTITMPEKGSLKAVKSARKKPVKKPGKKKPVKRTKAKKKAVKKG
jgi:hypothetical protein